VEPITITTTEFLDKISEGPGWAIKHNENIYVIELCITREKTPQFYRSPDLLDMPTAEYRRFMNELKFLVSTIEELDSS